MFTWTQHRVHGLPGINLGPTPGPGSVFYFIITMIKYLCLVALGGLVSGHPQDFLSAIGGNKTSLTVDRVKPYPDWYKSAWIPKMIQQSTLITIHSKVLDLHLDLGHLISPSLSYPIWGLLGGPGGGLDSQQGLLNAASNLRNAILGNPVLQVRLLISQC